MASGRYGRKIALTLRTILNSPLVRLTPSYLTKLSWRRWRRLLRSWLASRNIIKIKIKKNDE